MKSTIHFGVPQLVETPHGWPDWRSLRMAATDLGAGHARVASAGAEGPKLSWKIWEWNMNGT